MDGSATVTAAAMPAGGNIIEVGPLADGVVYKYDPVMDEWWGDDEPVEYVPHECAVDHRGMRRFHFDTRGHMWLDQDYICISNDDSVAVDSDFRRAYGLNGGIRMLSLG